MSIVVEAEKLSQRYGALKAVDEVSFTLESHKIYGLLGRNGAGKTTLMKLVTAQQLPSGGRLRVFGENPFENSRVLSQVCCIKESQRYPDCYRVTDVLEVAAALFPNWDASYAKSLLEQFRIPLKQRMKKLSREETDALRGRATAIAGAASRVEAFTLGRQVIRRDHFGGLATATVLGNLNAQERGEAKELGLELAPVSLQQLVVHLTGGNSERKAGEIG